MLNMNMFFPNNFCEAEPALERISVKRSKAKAELILCRKCPFALKETAETKYWLRLLQATDYLTEKEFLSINSDCVEIEKMLTTIIKSAKQ